MKIVTTEQASESSWNSSDGNGGNGKVFCVLAKMRVVVVAMLPRPAILPLLLCLALAVYPSDAAATEKNAGLQDLEGRAAKPFAVQGAKLLAFFFVRTDCPIANRYAPELQRIAAAYASRGVTCRLVYCDPDESAAEIRRHLAEYGYTLPALRDVSQRFARQSEVKITPEAALYQADGKLVYHGRIDDRHADLGKARPEPTQRDLTNAIEAALAGKAVPAATGEAVGCEIEGL